MANKYLDYNGALYFWDKLKSYFQAKLISGTNIRTINNESILGSGNITVFSGSYDDLTDKPTIPTVPTNVSAFTNDAGYLTSYTETDPTVPSWAKEASKPSYSASEISGLVDFFYPVGSYYETSITTFDPNVSWGGTWVLETAGMVHVSGGTGYAVSKANNNSGAGAQDGGSKDAIIPYHNHSVNAVNTGGMSANAKHTHKDGTNSAGIFGVVAGNTTCQVVANADSGRATTEADLAHTHQVPSHNTNYAGTSGNTTDANMQPYINVNRWHRTA